MVHSETGSISTSGGAVIDKKVVIGVVVGIIIGVVTGIIVGVVVAIVLGVIIGVILGEVGDEDAKVVFAVRQMEGVWY